MRPGPRPEPPPCISPSPAAGDAARLTGALAGLSKWSMLDVFVIARVVLVVDGQLLSSADGHVGVIAFAASVVASN